MFAHAVNLYGEEPALSRKIDGTFSSMTYRDLDRCALALAAAFVHVLRVQKGELVALVCNNRPEWIMCSLAIHFVGAVDVPRASDAPSEILKAILRQAQPTVAILENQLQLEKMPSALSALRAVVLVETPEDPAAAPPGRTGCTIHTLQDLLVAGQELLVEHAGEIEERRANVAPDDLATVIYTSGTTGTPKGVALTHNNYMLNIKSIPAILGADRERVLSILQPWHAYERQVQLMGLSVGCCIYYSGILTLRGDLKAVRPTVLATVPELWVTLYKGVWQKIAAEKPMKHALLAGTRRDRSPLPRQGACLPGVSRSRQAVGATRSWRRLTALASAGLNWPAMASQTASSTGNFVPILAARCGTRSSAADRSRTR